MGFTRQQMLALLADLDPARVHRTQGQDHLEAWDVRATLTRVFGFDGWSSEMTRPATLVFDNEAEVGKDKKPGRHVGYVATLRLTIRSPDGEAVVHHEGSAIGDSKMGLQAYGDCHDMAIKTAESQALKRAAMNLGTQFGLSLYDSGNQSNVVGPLVAGLIPVPDPEDVAIALDTISALTDLDNVRQYWRSLSAHGLLEVPEVALAVKQKGDELKNASSQAD